MNKNTLLLSWLGKNTAKAAAPMVTELEGAGFSVTLRPFRPHDAENWQETSNILSGHAGIWIIGGQATLFTPTIKAAMALMALTVRQARSLKTGVLLCPCEGEAPTAIRPSAPEFSDFLAAQAVLDTSDPKWAGRLVAALRKDVPPPLLPFVLKAQNLPLFGIWLTLAAPAGTSLPGVLAGVEEDVEIRNHAVAPPGLPPERCVLQHAIRDMLATCGDESVHLWGVRNQITDMEVYFLQLATFPRLILAGEYPAQDEAAPELHVLHLAEPDTA